MQGRQKNPSGHGIGKWQTKDSIGDYRKKRNKAKKLAKKARRK